MIIFGSRAKHKTIGKGQFHCPNCRTTRHYERKQAKRYFTLYFIPIIPLDNLGEFIQCQTCEMAFKPEVLQLPPPAPKLTLAEMLNSTGKLLEQGMPIEYLIRELTKMGLDREVALNTVRDSVGSERNRCPDCGLTYAITVTNCSECQHPLETHA